MSKSLKGISFCFIATILYATKYVCAAIYGAQTPLEGGFGASTFQKWLEFVGDQPLAFASVALLVGVIYLVLAEVEAFKQKK